MAWRHGLGERDVRRIQGTLKKAQDPGDRKKSSKKDIAGQSITRGAPYDFASMKRTVGPELLAKNKAMSRPNFGTSV